MRVVTIIDHYTVPGQIDAIYSTLLITTPRPIAGQFSEGCSIAACMGWLIVTCIANSEICLKLWGGT